MKYDYYQDSQIDDKGNISNLALGEGIGDTIGSALQGLASWIGLDGLLKEWNANTHKSTISKIKELRTKIQQLIAKGDIDLDALDKQIERLNLGNYNLTGRAAQIAGEYKKKLENNRADKFKANRANSIEYDKMLQDLDKAEEGARNISATGARQSREIADKVEKAIGGIK